MPRNKPLTNIDITRIAKRLKIPYFRGVYMRNALPKNHRKNESIIINLDDENSSGTHWCAVMSRQQGSALNVYYYDSYGDLPPPLEVLQYLSPQANIYYNYSRDQQLPTECGHLALEFLLTKQPQNKMIFKYYK